MIQTSGTKIAVVRRPFQFRGHSLSDFVAEWNLKHKKSLQYNQKFKMGLFLQYNYKISIISFFKNIRVFKIRALVPLHTKYIYIYIFFCSCLRPRAPSESGLPLVLP